MTQFRKSTDVRPEVSIVMPCYCASKTIAVSISSVQSQTMKNWELIIIDDCSTDNSVKIVEELAHLDKRIQIVKLVNNIGPAKSRNIGIERSVGKFI